jgi:hypothetical protein
MTEILTESFCERCGTRYTFETAKPRVRLKGVKVLSRGLKNFVLSDDTSMDEAMAAARSETDREATAHQLDAFHKTFNFCLSCRQYTCPNCWNEPEARCLTCAPLAVPEEPAVVDDLRAFRDALLGGEPTPVNGTADHEHEHAWAAGLDVEAEAAAPTGALAPEAAASEVELERAAAAPETEPEAVGGPASMAATPAAVEGQAAPAGTLPAPAGTPPAPAETPPKPTDPAGKAAAQTAGLLRRFRPGQSLDAELDAFERERTSAPSTTGVGEVPAAASVEPAPKPETLSGAPEADAVEAMAVETAAEPAETAAEPAETAAPEPEPEPLAAASATDVVEQPTWRISAPEAIGPITPTSQPAGEAGVPLQASASPSVPPDSEPQWPTRPQWPATTTPAAGLPFLGRPAAPQGGIEALWAASNQEVVTAAPPAPGRKVSGIQPCISCGLSLSANARFCRRCGTHQGHSPD